MTTDSASKFKLNTPQLSIFIALLILAFNLRGSLVIMGPLAETIGQDLQLSNISLGLLTTVPVLCFGIFSLFAANIAQRHGLELTLFTMLFLIAVGQLLRSSGLYEIMLTGTVILGASIAVMNVLTPSLVRRNFPQRIPLMTAIYTLVMSTGASIASYTAIPIRNIAFGDWRYAMGFWSVLAFFSLLAWLPMLRYRHSTVSTSTTKHRLWRQPNAWWLSVFFGCQSLMFYTCTAWLAKMFIDAGSSHYEAGTLLTLFNVFGTMASFLAPLIYSAFRHKKLAMLLLHVPMFIGLTGLLTNITGHPYIWVILMGLGQGSMISVGLTLIASHADSARTAAKLSGMCQSIGYLLAAGGPVIVGALYDKLHSWQLPITLLAGVILIQFIAALKVSAIQKISA